MTQQVANLFELYHQPIFAYLYRLVNDWELAHDLTQETFLRLLRMTDQLPAIENPRAFTYRIATNLAHNSLKRRRRFTWLPWRHVNEQQTATEDPAKRIHDQSDVAQLLAGLPLDYRIPLLLYSYDGLNVREVAAVLNLSEGAVKTRLFRAREMFRKAHEEEVDDESS
ncbi:MAG: RNA polymerase sigma factor [Anaerolineaceae bacterium]|nr:RNA polymerase sigma factor [Anaerolineaceae bacterium]